MNSLTLKQLNQRWRKALNIPAVKDMIFLKQCFIIAQLLVIYILKLLHFRGDSFIAPLICIEAVAAVPGVFKNVGTADIKLLSYDLQNQIDCLIQMFIMIQNTENIPCQIILTLCVILLGIDRRSQ